MARSVPFLGRLSLAEYVRLFFALALITIEPLLRVLFALVPPLKWVVDRACTRIKIYYQKPGLVKSISNEVKPLLDIDGMTEVHTTEDFIRFWEYPFQPHFITT
jgi:hypothetical protein